MTAPENYPREQGSESVEVPEGAILMEDGSFVFPDETVEVPAEETEEEKAARVQLLADSQAQQEREQQLLSEQAQVEMPREHGTDVSISQEGDL